MGSGVASACLLSTLQSRGAPGAASIQLLRRRFVTTEATAITHPEPHSWAEESPGTTQHPGRMELHKATRWCCLHKNDTTGSMTWPGALPNAGAGFAAAMGHLCSRTLFFTSQFQWAARGKESPEWQPALVGWMSVSPPRHTPAEPGSWQVTDEAHLGSNRALSLEVWSKVFICSVFLQK